MKENLLPPGQVEAESFSRFGLPWFAFRFPKNVEEISLRVRGDLAQPVDVSDRWPTLPPSEQVSDFNRQTNNEVVWRWDHDPYGNGIPNEDPDGNGLIVPMNLRAFVISTSVADLLMKNRFGYDECVFHPSRTRILREASPAQAATANAERPSAIAILNGGFQATRPTAVGQLRLDE